MVRQLTVTNFRSYGFYVAQLSPNATVVVGPNGSGKTNLLESLYVLATGKSFRSRDTELINHNASERFYRIVGKLGEDEVALGYQESDGGSTKRASRNQASVSLTQHIGQLQVVLFEPNNILLVYGSPEHRRNYLDVALVQTDATYRRTLSQYKRVLRQRNQVLGDWQGDTGALFAWNVQLVDLAATIYHRRQQLIHHLNKQLPARYQQIAGHKRPVELKYQTSISTSDPAEYATAFMAALEDSLPRDIGAGFTTIGPHRDDLSISFNGGQVTDRASRGEMRSLVLALKLAELDYVEQASGRKALLLLDDVFSELDAGRRHRLIEAVGQRQTVITTTDADHVTGDLADDVAIIYTKPEHQHAK